MALAAVLGDVIADASLQGGETTGDKVQFAGRPDSNPDQEEARNRVRSARLERSSGEKDLLVSELEGLRKKYRSLQEERNDLSERVVALAKEREPERRETQASRLERQQEADQIKTLLQEVEELRRQRDEMSVALKSSKDQAQSTESRVVKAKDEVAAAQRDLKRHKGRIQAKDVEISRLTEQFNRLARRLQGLEKSKVEWESKRAPASREQDPAPGGVQQEAYASAETPALFVEILGNRMFRIISTAETAPENQKRELMLLLQETVNLEEFTSAVLGSHWDSADPKKRREYQALFGSYIMRPLLRVAEQDRPKEFNVVDIKNLNHEKTRVNTTIVTSSGSSLNWDWIVKRTDDEFRIVDIMSHGISLIAVYRSELNSYLANKGLSALMADLRSLALASGIAVTE